MPATTTPIAEAIPINTGNKTRAFSDVRGAQTQLCQIFGTDRILFNLELLLKSLASGLISPLSNLSFGSTIRILHAILYAKQNAPLTLKAKNVGIAKLKAVVGSTLETLTGSETKK